MKSKKKLLNHFAHWSHPVRGAWIEMFVLIKSMPLAWKSHPVRGAWIEIYPSVHANPAFLSRTP